MSEVYRKRGRTLRYEHGRQIEVVESGVAIEDGVLFTCRPEPADVPPLDVTFPALHLPNIERLLLIEGIAEHEYNGVTWTEHTQRLHISLAREQLRVLIDLASFDLAFVEHIAAAFANCEGVRPAPPRLRLAPNVAAALLPSLIGIAPPNIHLVQTAGGYDGKGDKIEERPASQPYWYRPSYRVRPTRAPLNLTARCDVTRIDEDRPRAIALLAPVDGLTLRVLIEDGRRVYASEVLVARIDAIAGDATFYPYGAGSFGAEMML